MIAILNELPRRQARGRGDVEGSLFRTVGEET